MAVPYHTHSFEIPSATKAEVEAGVRTDVAATPASLGSAASKDVSYFATAAQGALADTAVQPTLNLVAGDGLTGGGTLAANRIFALSSISLASLALADTAVQTINGKSGRAITLSSDDVSAVPIARETEIIANTAARHTHSNKAVLDATTAAFTTAMSSKLAGIPADADKTPALAAVATSGNYADLNGKPTLGSLAAKNNIAVADISATGTPSAATFLRGDGAWGTVAGAGTVTSVGLSAPTGFAVSGSPVTGSGTLTITHASGYQGYTTAEANKLAGIAAGADKTPALAAVATTGSYIDLSDKPAIPAAQVQTNWNAVSGISSIANKPAAFPPSAHTHTPSEVGLGNVANKTEAQMVASGAIADKFTNQQSAINGKQNNLGYTPINKAGDTFTGDVNIPYVDVRRGTAYTQQSLLGLGWGSGYVPWRFVLNADQGLAWWAYNPNTGDGFGQRMFLSHGGNLAINGSLSKGSGTFLIDHPLDPANKNLRHGFTEAPEYLNIYRGVVRLVNGKATVNIDEYFGMMFGTFWTVNTGIMVSALQNQEGGTAVWPESKMTGGILKITCADPACNDEIAWMVTGRRKDPYVLYLDPNCEHGTGRFIPEVNKEV